MQESLAKETNAENPYFYCFRKQSEIKDILGAGM